MEAEEKRSGDVISREGKRGPRSGSSATPLLLLLLHPTGSTAKMRRRRFLSEVPFGSPVCRLPTLRVADSKFQSRGNRLTSVDLQQITSPAFARRSRSQAWPLLILTDMMVFTSANAASLSFANNAERWPQTKFETRKARGKRQMQLGVKLEREISICCRPSQKMKFLPNPARWLQVRACWSALRSQVSHDHVEHV